jgi:3-hydroxybutyryl-CoA dehydrogenase
MGSGIVEVVARAGADVVFVEGSEELVASGRVSVERSVGKAVDRGKLQTADAQAMLERVSGATDLAALDGSDLVIEAATEDLEAKIAIFRTLGEVTRPEVILASNTSSIPIVELALASERPDRVIGMHFFNPPGGATGADAASTSDETVAFIAPGTDVLSKTCVSKIARFIVAAVDVPLRCDPPVRQGSRRPGRDTRPSGPRQSGGSLVA